MEEKPKINILEKFSLWTVLLPYYCECHEGFRLLCSFNKVTREGVMKHYDLYLFCMRNNVKFLEFNEEGKPAHKRIQIFKILRIMPLDFFKVKVVLYTSN